MTIPAIPVTNRYHRLRATREDGFTLVEILVVTLVVSIIGLMLFSSHLDKDNVAVDAAPMEPRPAATATESAASTEPQIPEGAHVLYVERVEGQPTIGSYTAENGTPVVVIDSATGEVIGSPEN